MSNIEKFEDKFDLVVRYYADETGAVTLPADLERELERWKFVRVLYSSWKSASTVELVNTIKKEFGVSEATAYRDLRNAKQLFAQLEPVNREFERLLMIERIKQLRDKAIKKGDFRSASACDANLIKIGGYDKELEPPRPIIHVHNEITYDPSAAGAEDIPDLEKQIDKFKRTSKRNNDAFEEAEEL